MHDNEFSPCNQWVPCNESMYVPIPVGTSYIEQKNYLVSLLISNLDHADRFGFLCYCNNIKGDYNHKKFFMKIPGYMLPF